MVTKNIKKKEFIEKVRSTAAKKMEAASEALLKAREAGEGPVFNDDQNANLAAVCTVSRRVWIRRNFWPCIPLVLGLRSLPKQLA